MSDTRVRCIEYCILEAGPNHQCFEEIVWECQRAQQHFEQQVDEHTNVLTFSTTWYQDCMLRESQARVSPILEDETYGMPFAATQDCKTTGSVLHA